MRRDTKTISSGKGFYYLTFILFFSSCVCAVIYAFQCGNPGSDGVKNYVANSLSENTDIMTYTKICIFENIKFAFLLLISSSAPLLFPLTAFLVVFKGFSLGFTATLIIKIYSLKGLGFCFFALVIPYAFYLPVLFKMFTSSMSVQFKKQPSSYTSSNKNDMASHSAFLAVCTLILCIISFAGAIFTHFGVKIFI